MLDTDYAREVAPHVRAAMDRLRDPQAVWDIFRDERVIAEMEQLTARQRPAVGAASRRLLALGDWVRARDPKTTFGKIARAVLEKRGYVIDAKGILTPQDPLFTKGARYRLRESAEPRSAVISVSGLDPDLLALLRVRAARNRRSVEAEAGQIIAAALRGEKSGTPDLARAIHRRFAALGGVDDLPIHPPVSTEASPEIDR